MLLVSFVLVNKLFLIYALMKILQLDSLKWQFLFLMLKQTFEVESYIESSLQLIYLKLIS